MSAGAALAAAWGAFPLAAALIGWLLWRGRPPLRLLLDAALIGVTLGAAAAFAEAPFELRTNPLRFSPATLAFLFAGLPEEGLKMLGAAAFLRRHYLTRDRRDATLAAGALALGFAGLENLFYLAGAGTGFATLAFERAVTATPFHVFLGLAGGFAVASARPGLAGVAGAVAAWLGLAAIHGVYDFAVFATAASAAPHPLVDRAAAALRLDPATALRGLLAAAELAAALAAGAALAAAKPGPRPATLGRLARAAQSRLVGALVGTPLIGGSLGAVALAAAMAYARDSAAPLVAVAALALSPLALGAMFLTFPPEAPRRALSPQTRRLLVGLSGAAALLAVGAAFVWGPAQARRLQAMRFEAAAARAAAGGDYERAIQDCSRAIALAPDDIGPLALRASAETAAARYDAARADLDAALRLAPNSVPLYLQRAELDRRRDDSAAAATDLDAALARKPDDPDLLALRSGARLEAGDSPGAAADLAAARRLAPDLPTVRRAAAALETDAGDFDAAIADLNARLHADPQDATAAFQRGRVWLYKGDARRALADFTRADRDGALYPAMWAYLARRASGEGGATELAARLDATPVAWPAAVARSWLTPTADDPLALAASPGERCEAIFYAAAAEYAAGDADAATPGLRAALETCPPAYIEREGAKAMLRRLAR